MLLPPIQLLDSGFRPIVQASLWPEETVPLRFVVKLHRATRLHYDFRLELYGRLLSFATNDLNNVWQTSAQIARVGDHDLKYLLSERCIPPGLYGAGPTLVWDHGIYRSQLGTEEDIYRQLLEGCLEIDIQGVRLNGRYRISGRGEQWRIQRVSGEPVPTSNHSVLTGRTLNEIEAGIQSNRAATRLWLQWEHFYTEQTLVPEVAIHEKKVVDLNFAARVRGASVGMFLQHILPLIPDCQVRQFSPSPTRQKAWLNRLLSFTDTIQPFDCHSAAVDLSAHPDPSDIAGKIVQKLTTDPFGFLNYGTGPSLWIAQLATQLNSPFGFTINTAERLAPLSIEHLLALPLEDRERLIRLGYETIGEVAQARFELLHQQFGQSAHHIVTAARGKTCDKVVPLYPPQAILQTIGFESPINDEPTIQRAIALLAQRLSEKISGRQAGLAILTVELEDGTERTLERPYNRPIHSSDRIQASLSYLVGELQKSSPDIIRLTARLDSLEPIKSSQQDLFVASHRSDAQVALNSLKAALGDKSVILASQIEIPRREQVLKAWRNATGWN